MHSVQSLIMVKESKVKGGSRVRTHAISKQSEKNAFGLGDECIYLNMNTNDPPPRIVNEYLIPDPSGLENMFWWSYFLFGGLKCLIEKYMEPQIPKATFLMIFFMG